MSSDRIFSCQILFSDIELKTDLSDSQPGAYSNGMKACIALRRNGFKGEIIFLTAFKEYVFEGYDVQALSYILKPIQNDALYQCMNRYIALHCSDYYYYHKGDCIIQIPYNDIISISRIGHDCAIQTVDSFHTQRIALKSLEDHLPAQFLRCHKSCIINVFHIKSLSGTNLRLSNNKTQTVGRNYLEDIRKALLRLVNDDLGL